MPRLLRSRLFIACVASTMTAVVVGGIAWAVQSPVDSNGVVHACYNPSNGNMHLNVTGKCPSTGQNTPITWSVAGPSGEGVYAQILGASASGALGPASKHATKSQRINVGGYLVTFDRVVSTCAYAVTPLNAVGSYPAFIPYRGPTQVSYGGVTFTLAVDQVFVVAYGPGDQDADVDLTVTC